MPLRNYSPGTILARREGWITRLMRVEEIVDHARRYSVLVKHVDGRLERLADLRPDLPIERAKFGYRVATHPEAVWYARNAG